MIMMMMTMMINDYDVNGQDDDSLDAEDDNAHYTAAPQDAYNQYETCVTVLCVPIRGHIVNMSCPCFAICDRARQIQMLQVKAQIVD